MSIRKRVAGLWLIGAVLAWLPAWGSAAALSGFRAEYALSVGWFPLGRAAFELRPDARGDGRWEAHVEARMFGMRNREFSRFVWNGCQPRTERYEHVFSGLGIRRASEMTFDWAAPPTVTNVGRKGTSSYAIRTDTLDEVTLLLSARCVFADGADSWSTTTAYGNRLRTHELRAVGTDIVDGPDGARLEAVVIEKVHKESTGRRTRIWVAPALDWMLVKARHTEGGLSGTIELRRLERIDAPPVQPAVAGPDARPEDQSAAATDT